MTKRQWPMTEDGKSSERRDFDLAERTAAFGEAVIEFVRAIRRSDVSGPIIRQLIRAATSIGANYTEADERVRANNFAIASAFAAAKRVKPSIGFACLPPRSRM